MNIEQRYLVVSGLLICFALALVPPWKIPIIKVTTYGLIWAPPVPGSSIDVSRLVLQVLLVFIACAVLYVVFGGPSPGTTQEAATKKRFALIVSAIVFSMTAAAGILSFFDFQDKMLCFREATAESAHQARIGDLREALEQRLDAIKKEQEDQARIVEAIAVSKRLDDLAKQRTWPPVAVRERSVAARAITYWRDGSMVLRLQMYGSPEPLELAMSQGKSYSVSFKNREGLVSCSTQFASSDFKPYQGKKGTMSIMMTAPQKLYCSAEGYSGLATCELSE